MKTLQLVIPVILIVESWHVVLEILRQKVGRDNDDIRTELLLRVHPLSLVSLVLLSFLWGWIFDSFIFLQR